MGKLDKEKNTPAQSPEEATTVGQFLKFTRLSQKKTIETVSKDLCIRKIYIKAIEESNFEELPPIPYGIGFVRSYAEYLGLNNDRIAQCYKEEALPSKVEETPTQIVTTHTTATIPNRRQILTGIIAVVLIYLIWLAVSCKPQPKVMLDTTPPETITPTTEPTITQAQNVLDEKDLSATEPLPEDQIKIVDDSYVEEPQSTNNNSGIITPAQQEKKDARSEKSDSRIVVKFNGDSWFEVRDHKKVYVSGIFKKGYVYNVPNLPGLIFSVGRYYNVDVYIDGQLTQVARPKKQTNIKLDNYLNH